MEEVSPRDNEEYTIITDREKDDIEKNPRYMLDMFKTRIRGISTLTQTIEIASLHDDLMVKLSYAQRIISGI